MVAFNINKLLCISTGLTATAGDGINCDHAEEIGSNKQANVEKCRLSGDEFVED